MPDKSTTHTVPVTCQQCGKVSWYNTDDWSPPVLCAMCEAEKECMPFVQKRKRVANDIMIDLPRDLQPGRYENDSWLKPAVAGVSMGAGDSEMRQCRRALERTYPDGGIRLSGTPTTKRLRRRGAYDTQKT